MQLLIAATALSTLFSRAIAFQVTFYAGDRCRSQRVGSVDVSVSSGCQGGQMWNGISQSVTVEPSATDDPSFSVSFYEGDSCDLSRAVGSANLGCISVGSGDNPYGSFNVIGGLRVASNASEVQSEPVQEQKNTPRHDVSTKELQHGDFTELDGKLWRWHQITKGAFQGVRPSDWDEMVHIANDEPNGATERIPLDAWMQDSSPNPAAVLLAQPVEDFCEAMSTCGQVVTDAVLGFPTNTASVASAIAGMKTAGTSILAFLERPLIISIVLPVGSTLLTQWITAQWSGEDAPEDCTGTNEDSQVLTELINLGAPATGRNVQAIRNVIRNGPRNEDGTLSISYLPDSVENSGQYCGAPGRVVAFALPPSRVKRDMLSTVPGFDEWLMTRALKTN